MRRLLPLFLLVLAMPLRAHEAHGTPPWQEATRWPDRIVVTLPGDPATGFAVTWRTDASVTETIAEIAPATDDARFDLDARTEGADTERLDLEGVELGGERYLAPWNTGLPPVHFHSVRFEGLEPDTVYAYRVRGDRGAWSEWFQLRTAARGGPVKFLYVGDAQNGVRSHWARLIRSAFAAAPDADFILHAGDLVNRASRDLEWAEWFEAVGFIHGMVPAVPVAGNHEYTRLGVSPRQTDRILSILWRPQFTLPREPELPTDLQEAAYELRYSEDVHLFVLSTQNSQIAEQAEWLDGALDASDARWKIVTMHHPIFSSGRGRHRPPRRAPPPPVLERHGLDLLPHRHDPTYARGAIGQRPERLGFTDEGGEVQVMFVNSVSGPKQYTFMEDGWDKYADEDVVLARRAENTQFFQVIEIDGDELRYEARTALGALYDDFVMRKDRRGRKTIVRGATSTMDERLFETTGPYSGAGDLK